MYNFNYEYMTFLYVVHVYMFCNVVADLLWLFRSFYLRRSSVESLVERDFFIRILFQAHLDRLDAEYNRIENG